MNGFMRLFAISLVSLMCFTTACGPGPVGTGPCTGDECTDPDPFHASVIATLPSGASGDVIVGDQTMPCVGSCNLELEEAYNGEVQVDCPGHIFIPKMVNVEDGDEVPVTWHDDGSDWGLAPNGIYEGQASGDLYEVETRFYEFSNTIILMGLPISGAVVTSDKFETDYVQDTTNYMTGTISEDLSVIHIQLFDNGSLYGEEDAILISP